MRTDLALEDVGGFLDERNLGVLATFRLDGSVLLSPIWYEWRDGGFNLWAETGNAKTRHLRRDPRATFVVAESEPPYRGVEIRAEVRFVEENVTETALRIASRYIDPDEARADTEATRGTDVIIRIEAGKLRVWDFADEYDGV